MKVILIKDYQIGDRTKKKGTILEVTNKFGIELIAQKIARSENIFDKLKKNK